jgi:hypothetical protein
MKRVVLNAPRHCRAYEASSVVPPGRFQTSSVCLLRYPWFMPITILDIQTQDISSTSNSAPS